VRSRPVQVIIRWKLKPDGVERELQLLRAVYEELESAQPHGVHYTTFQLEDKISFVALVELTDGPQVLQQLPAFQRYRETLGERCDEPPATAMLHEVGAYRFH
jgi:hypothetical protein